MVQFLYQGVIQFVMGKWALLTITLVLASGISVMIAPATISALPQHPVDTSKTIAEFGENVKIYLHDKSPGDGKKKPPGKQGKPPPNKTPGEGEPPKKPGKPKKK